MLKSKLSKDDTIKVVFSPDPSGIFGDGCCSKAIPVIVFML